MKKPTTEQQVTEMAIALAIIAERHVAEVGHDHTCAFALMIQAALISAGYHKRDTEFYGMLESIRQIREMHNGPLKPSMDEIERKAMRGLREKLSRGKPTHP
jgi:hypothetical protein